MRIRVEIVIDLGFNPTPRKAGCGLRFEIIEIGAAKPDAKGNVQGEFSCLVKPRHSQFVKRQIVLQRKRLSSQAPPHRSVRAFAAASITAPRTSAGSSRTCSPTSP